MMLRGRYVRRPKPNEVAAVVRILSVSLDRPIIPPAAVVAALRREIGCSRATAYRALADALKAGGLRRV